MYLSWLTIPGSGLTRLCDLHVLSWRELNLHTNLAVALAVGAALTALSAAGEDVRNRSWRGRLGDGGRPWREWGRPSKGEAGADGVRHERFAEAAAHRVLGSPSGAVRGHQQLRRHLRQVVEQPRDQRLEQRPVEVEAAHRRVQRLVPGEPPGVAADVHDPGVPAPGQHDQALA